MRLHTRKKLAVFLGPDMPVRLQMRWAVCLANARQLDLLLLLPAESNNENVEEVLLDEPPSGKTADIIQDIQSVIEESSLLRIELSENSDSSDNEEAPAANELRVSMKLMHFSSLVSLRRTLLDEVGKQDVVLCTVAHKQITDTSDVELIRQRGLFIRYIPCEVMLCLGLEEDTELSRVLVATKAGSSGKAALRLGEDLACATDGTLTVLHINPDVGDDAEQVGERRLARFLAKVPLTKKITFARRVAVHDNVTQGIRCVWDEGQHDIVVVAAAESHFEENVGAKLGKDMPVVIVRNVSPLANRTREFIEERLHRIVPQIAREDRVALVDRVQSSSDWNFDFLTLMVLSTIMAAIGLIQNSAAVVIGAMLVAPLMTPLLGLGLALVQGNQSLARMSLRSALLGLCVSLLVGALVGLCTPGFDEPTREMLARGGPGLLDLAVAFAAGLAAAYASSRPGLIAALPGVAIAAALVPPVATSGLALSMGDYSLAIGALLLFAINMVTITLAAMASLWMVGIRNLKRRSRWITRVGRAIIVMVLALGIFLSLKPQELELTEQLPLGLLEAVRGNIGSHHKLESLAIGYDELGVQMNVQIAGNIPASAEMSSTVRALVRDFYEQPVRVRLLTRIELVSTPEE